MAFDGAELAKELEEEGLSYPSNADNDEEYADAALDEAESQISEYFAKKRESFSLVLDLHPTLPGPDGTESPFVSAGAPFRSRAQLALLHVGYGETASYGDVARLLQNPGAARAVGTACATNPLPIILPCHRIVRSDGKLGEYAGGVELKETLLEHERGEG